MSLQIEDVMVKKVITIQEDTSLKHAVSKMNEHEIGCLVVIKDKRPVGILTERDLLKKVLANIPELTKIKVQTIMSTPVKNRKTRHGTRRDSKINDRTENQEASCDSGRHIGGFDDFSGYPSFSATTN